MSKIPRDEVVLAACVSADYDASYLKHYIEHYQRLCSEIRLTVNASTEDVMERFPFIHNISGCQLFYEKWIGGFSSEDQMQHVLRHLSSSNKKWAMHADVDELHAGPLMVASGESFAYGVMIDRLAEDLRPAPVQTEPSLSQQFPRSARLTRYLVEACDHKPVIWLNHKYTVYDPHRLEGHSTRFIRDYMARNGTSIINHYKWTSSTLEKLVDVYAYYVKHGVSYCDEKIKAQIFYDEDRFTAWLNSAPKSVFRMSDLRGGSTVLSACPPQRNFFTRLYQRIKKAKSSGDSLKAAK